MSVLDIAEGDLFTIRTFKTHVNNPSRPWANNYEFRAKAAGGEGALASLLGLMVDFEKAFHTTVIKFIRASASTWEPDSVPYDPEAFISIPFSDLGAHSGDSQGVALNTCVRVNRIPLSGRFGMVFYRGVLLEDEIEAPNGMNILSSGSGLPTTFAAALTDSGLQDILAGDDPAWEMVMVNAAGTQIRRVAGLLIGGISTVPMDHTWFNRSSVIVP